MCSWTCNSHIQLIENRARQIEASKEKLLVELEKAMKKDAEEEKERKKVEELGNEVPGVVQPASRRCVCVCVVYISKEAW